MTTETLAVLADRFVYSTIAVYALALLAYAADSALEAHQRAASDATGGRWSARRLGAVGTALVVLAVTLNALGALSRGLAAQRVPWGNMYEFVIVATTAVGAAYLVFLARTQIRALGVWLVMLNLTGLGLAVTVLYTPVGVLVPVLDSYWLVIHVAAAIIAGAVFTIGAGATGLSLLKQRAESRAGALVTVGAAAATDAAPARPSRYATALPPSLSLDQVAHTAHLLAFPIWTFAVIAGAVWAENAWGRYWGWDPKETWAFITWVCYAAHLHARSTPSWRGRRAAWLALAGYTAFLFNFFGVNLWISGLHSYAGV